MAMVATGELDDFVALGVGAGDPDRGHDRLGAGIDETHLVHGRDGDLQHFGQGDLKLRRRPVEGAVLSPP